MGSRGPQQKPEHRRQRRNKPASIAITGARGTIPDPPDGLLKSTLEHWSVYWTSELSQATRPAHLKIVRRLFRRYDERERAMRTVRRAGRVTKGSQGQLVLHPLLKYIDQCEAAIRQDEDRLGLNPRAMAQLGASFASAQKSLDELNSDMETDDQDDGDGDPRVAIVS